MSFEPLRLQIYAAQIPARRVPDDPSKGEVLVKLERMPLEIREIPIPRQSLGPVRSEQPGQMRLRRSDRPEILVGTIRAEDREMKLSTLRANKSETFDCLKFTLEGAGERSDGYARTPFFRLAFLA